MSAVPSLLERLRPRWPSASLSTYMVAVLLLATTPIAALMAFQRVDAAIAERDGLADQLGATAATLAASIERELGSSIDALAILSRTDALQRGDVEAFRRVLVGRGLLRPSWSGAYLVDARGRRLFDTVGASAPPALPPADEAGEAGVPARAPRVSGVLDDRLPGHRLTAIEVPVTVDGQARYRLGAWIDVAAWQGLLQQSRGDAPGYTNLYDGAYRIVARTRAPERFIGQRLVEAATRQMQAQPESFGRLASLEGEPVYAAWRRVPRSDWGVAVAVDAEPLDRRTRNAILTALGTVAACLLGSVTLALMVVRRVVRPLERLAREGGAPHAARLPVREFELLNDALRLAAHQDAQARHRLKSKADEFETLFESSPIGLAFAQDPQCREVLQNAALGALVGPSLDTAEFLRDGVALPPAEQPLQVAAARGEAVRGQELEIRVAGRAPRFAIAHAVPLRDAAGRPRGALGALVDITERKHAEARLMEADERLRESQRLVDLAQEAGHVGFFHYRFDEAALAWTAGQAMLFGIDERPLGGSLRDWGERIDPADRERVEATLGELFAAQAEKATLEFRVTLPDGAARWLSSRVLMSYGPGGVPQQMVGITVDMTDQKEAERERAALIEREQAARRDAERASRAKDEFLAMLGHELRNPMSAIGSAVELLGRVPPASDVAGNARDIIDRQTRHLAHLLDDLLDVGRVISGKILLARQRFDLAAIVERLVGTVRLTGALAQHTLETSLHEAWVEADVTRIEQVLSNLLGNAGKYTPPGGRIEVVVRLEETPDAPGAAAPGGAAAAGTTAAGMAAGGVAAGDVAARGAAELGAAAAGATPGDGPPPGAEAPARVAVLEVRDNGIGIAPELLPHVFDLFVQGERSLDRRAGGLGVGLTLVRRLVELHGGSVEVESSPAGSVFRVRLPAQPAPPPKAAPSALPESRRRRIAVIEDNQDALNALRTILELDGHAVSSATDGVSGLAAVLKLRPDIAIVDIGLPGLTGLELALRSRAAGYPGRMIAISGYGQESDVREALKSGFDAHLVKPINATALRQLIAEQ